MPRFFIVTFLSFLAFFVAFFSPAEFGKLMASGDALVESVPAFFGAHHLWEPAMLLGYPLFADPNQQFWYPLAWVHLLPHTFNAFAVAPFVLAASSMAGFVRSLTRSTHAGVVAGLVYALGGFMISHEGHLMLTHPAAWVPFALWGLESMRNRIDGVPVVATAVALGLCGLSGQPQLLVFAATLAALYAIVSAPSARDGAPRYLLRATAALMLGFASAATQLIPEALLARDGTRADVSFETFTWLQIPADQVATRLVFPYLLGNSTLPWYPFSRVDLGIFTEETIYVGLVALALALLAVRLIGEDRRIAFWYAVALGALVLAIGDATPLARITHQLPVFKLFRAPGRHAFEFSFAIAVLAGYGSAALARGRARSSHVAFAIGCVAILAVSAYAQLLIAKTPALRQVAEVYGVDRARVASPLLNGAVGIPLATGLFGCAMLWFAGRMQASRVAAVLLVLAVVTDVGAFGWSAYWNWAAVNARATLPQPWAVSLAAQAHATHTRLAWLSGVQGAGMQPNLTTLWNVPVIGGYTPLVPIRTQAMLGLIAGGGAAPPPAVDDTGFDVAGASIVASIAHPGAAVTAANPLANDDLQITIGSPDQTAASRAAFGLPAPFAATRVAMVSALLEVNAAGGSRFAELDVIDVAGRHERHAMFRDPGEATGHSHQNFYTISTRLPIARIDVLWTNPAHVRGALNIEKLSLIDDLHGRASAYSSFAAFYAAPKHWRPIATHRGIIAFENLQVMPRWWFGTPVLSDEIAAVEAVRGGILPTGVRFDAKREVMVEGIPGVTDAATRDDRRSVRVVEDAPVRQIFVTSCATACFFVVRDAFDSQWHVTVDGRSGIILPTDVALRGVALPAGTHRVAFTFIPTSLYVGLGLSGIAVLCFLVLLYGSYKSRKCVTGAKHLSGTEAAPSGA